MRITNLYIKSYKNLQDFTWELNPDYPVAVIVGKNASGKSNLLEAILMIFVEAQRDIEVKFNNFPFEFEISYQLGDFIIETVIMKYTDNEFSCFKNQRIIDPIDVLPNKIVSYYAGISERFLEIIKEYLINKKNRKRSFDIIHIETVHYKFALLTLLASKLKRLRTDLLAEKLEIVELVSFNLKIQKPISSLPEDASKENFWSAPNNLAVFFGELYKNKDWVEETKDEIVLGFKNTDLEGVMKSSIINDYEDNFFDLLSKSFANGYIKELDILFKKNGVTEILSFEALSEGEKQRIGMRGTIELFLGNETLFLLDEPDAFAHPRWQWQFVPDLQETLGDSRSSQVIFVTHSPLVLSTVRDNAFMMEGGQIQELNDLYGMDVDTVLIDGMETSVRPPQVAEDFEPYFILIECGRGETDEAQKMRQNLENIYPLNHPSFSKADMLRSLYI
jgi:predicted ATPase